MDCRTARHLLEFRRPRIAELDREDHQALEGHLAVCLDCDSLARAEHQADEHLGQAIRDVPIPQGLRERLLQRLHEEREAWYRRWLARGLRVAAAAAAVFLIAFFAVNSWRQHHLPRLEASQLTDSALAQHSYSPPSREDAQRDLKTIAPSDFDYRHLFSYHRGDFRIGNETHRGVPCLLFVRVDDRGLAQVAQVYVLSDRRFDLRNLPEVQGSPSGDRYHVEVWHPTPEYAYVIVYSGDLQDMLVSNKERRRG